MAFFTIPQDETPVTSSNLESVKYDLETETLYIRFVGRGKYAHAQYAYSNTPKFYFDAILDLNERKQLYGAPVSLGQWFATEFKKTPYYKNAKMVDQPFPNGL